MGSEIDILKTNEILRRRKLRLQQVREQSKDIAKRIRQRANVEKQRHVTDIDAKKEKEYIDCQEKLVKQLELFYTKSLENVGASHKEAFDASIQEIVERRDLSKLRGKEAEANLKKKKQAQLDEQRKLLDRKLRAREVANEISREKTIVVKNIKKLSSSKLEAPSKVNNINDIGRENSIPNPVSAVDNPVKERADMGTQWESEELLNEWNSHIPNVPSSLPTEASKSVVENDRFGKNRKLDLFALSDEMPSSLRGSTSNVPENNVPMKPTLTLVSEYLQNRKLNLRQPESSKKPADDLQNIKQTIQHTRSYKVDGNTFDNVCLVLDEQVMPVPSWHPGNSCISSPFHNTSYNSNCNSSSKKFNISNKQLCPSKQKNDNCKTPTKTGIEKSSRTTAPDIPLSRRQSVSVYNHITRDTHELPCGEQNLVFRDNRIEEDAYSQALRETTSANTIEKEQSDKRQESLRNKIAITKQNVDKEYRDTLSFLNSLPKSSGDRPIRTAYMDDQQQHFLTESCQKKLEKEYRKIEKEHQRHTCKHSKRKSTILEKNGSTSKSPVSPKQVGRDFEYSWMPVPETDRNLAVHTIPNTRKHGNSVKFSENDSYHEYRSRHKHTPPTKEENDKQSKRVVKTVIVENESENESSLDCDTSSVENLNLERNDSVSDTDPKMKEAERIIIYKILNSRKGRTKHKKSVLSKNGKSLTNNHDSATEKTQDNIKISENVDGTNVNQSKNISFENLQEGVYKASNDGDNITSMYFTEDKQDGKQLSDLNTDTQNADYRQELRCSCKRDLTKNQMCKDNQNEGGDIGQRKSNIGNCKCADTENNNLSEPSAATSTSSFKTAPIKASSTVDANVGDGFLKLVDEGGIETGKFYIGASGFIKDDNYEVVIQLRKKETLKSASKIDNKVSPSEISKVSITETDDRPAICIQKDDSSVAPSLKNKETSPISSNITVDKGTVIENSVNVKLQNEEVNVQNGNTTGATKSGVSEKAVETSFQDNCPIFISEPKTDATQKPATSIYTQTSFNSSIQRPVFLHMSSSTSTAYMSPPEIILPKFLRNDYILSHEEMCESSNTFNQLDSQYEAIATTSRKDNGNARTKKCTCSKKRVSHINNHKRYKIETPPNTARSVQNSSLNGSAEIKKRKCKCHKCKTRTETKTGFTSHKKSNTSVYAKSSRETGEINIKPSSNASSKHRTSKLSKKLSQPKIHPSLQTYVHKLLALNKEGLKAVEIINQDCSTPTTPGSSIINLPSNKDEQTCLENKISLEQIKNILKKQILEDRFQRKGDFTKTKNTEIQTDKAPLKSKRLPKKKSLHKVKSLNISKQVHKKTKSDYQRSSRCSKISTSSSTRDNNSNNVESLYRSRSKSSPTPRHYITSEYKNSTSSDITDTGPVKISKDFSKTRFIQPASKTNCSAQLNSDSKGSLKFCPSQVPKKGTSMSSDSEYKNVQYAPSNATNQTSCIIDAEINFMKLAENKLQNMEKIADLTDRCTKRLSDLAKVLEEVRRNKSLVYTQISTSDSNSEPDMKSDKSELASRSPYNPNEVTEKEMILSEPSLTVPDTIVEKSADANDSTEFIPVLKGIPKPETPATLVTSHTDQGVAKTRGRPPPALTRANLRNGQEGYVIPHELSTVIEVDSPMSLKLKNQSSRQESKVETTERTSKPLEDAVNIQNETVDELTGNSAQQTNLSLLENNVKESKHHYKMSSNESSDDSKLPMMDMKQFNEIMLKPFISLQDYAKHCEVGLDEGSNLEDAKSSPINDELSSLHSDGSLPDVIAELLKRKIISEPFKFDTVSNVNSTTLSSESTLSLIALSKGRKGKKKPNVLFKNKENLDDTSESLSMSSNPDLEHAFKKLGMGWASSTLKKTKERLALSSSSNTSSCSLTKFKMKSFSQDVPTFASDSTSSLADVSNKREKKNSSNGQKENSKSVVQQTSLTNSMTVKEFLTNVLANKITFNNQSERQETNQTQPDFVSLYETNMPEDMKLTKVRIEEDRSSVSSTNNNRARTSTPVRIFKSAVYNSSSSNTSNGLFSNADDLSSVKVTSTSIRNHSTSDKDELTIPNYSLKTGKALSDRSKSD